MTETGKADGRRQTREEWGRRLEEAKTTQAAKTAAEWLHDRKEAAARRSFVPSIQARFIAAYTDRRPEDIKGEELAKCQAFWNKHPEATADLMAGGIDDDTLRQMLAQWMNTDIVKDFIFHGADLKAAYLQYDAQGRRLVDSALGKDGVVFSERYIRAAILPDVENGFVGRLDEGVKGEIRRAFNLKTRPAVAVSAFLLFCAVYDMSNEERRGRLADGRCAGRHRGLSGQVACIVSDSLQGKPRADGGKQHDGKQAGGNKAVGGGRGHHAADGAEQQQRHLFIVHRH